MKLIGYKKIEGIIEVVTGLHIGGSTSIIEIGGKDNPVIKHPITNEPYIPGSTLKGKMRSLLEMRYNFIDNRDKINGEKNNDYGKVHSYRGMNCNRKECPICVIFGTSADNADLGPTRIIVRDAFLEEKYKDELVKRPNWTPFGLTEDKWENTINRITASANPRNFERVIPGAKFKFSISYRVFDDVDKENKNIDEKLFIYVIEGLKLIEKDALGGAGSRGCGQVKFRIKVNSEYKELDQIQPEDFKTVE